MRKVTQCENCGADLGGPAVTYTNYVRSDIHSMNEIQGSTWGCPKDAQWLLEDSELRVEMRWNGNPVRPPVGIKAERCSHKWAREKYHSLAGIDIGGAMQLVPR